MAKSRKDRVREDLHESVTKETVGIIEDYLSKAVGDTWAVGVHWGDGRLAGDHVKISVFAPGGERIGRMRITVDFTLDPWVGGM